MIYLFNSSEEVIKIVPSTAIRSFYQTQSLTSEKYISDRVDIELKALPEEILKQIEYVAIPDIQDKYRFHLFFVVREATEGNITEITGVQSGIEELRKSPVYDIRPQDRTVRFAAEQIIQGTNWTVGYAPDDVRVGNMNVYYSSAFEGLKTLCEKTDVEMQFFVEINGNKVGNRYIEFKKRIGKNVGRRVVYGHNALQIIKEVEKTDLVTALVGRGRGEEVSSAEENAGGVAGYGRKITFEEIEWKKANGDPVDKPLGQKYVEIPEMTAIYGVQTPTGKRPKFGFIEFDTDDRTEVLRRTYEALLWVSRPKVEFKTSSVYLKDTYIGDTVRVIRHDRGLAYETRVFEIKIDRISGRCEIKLGDKLSGNDGLSVSKLSSQITNLENSLSQTVRNIVTNLPSADGFTRNWYTDQEPSDPRVGDTWFKPDPEHEGHTIMLTWNGEVWDEILRTYNDTRVADKLAEIDTQTQAMEAAIQENEAKARELFGTMERTTDLALEAHTLIKSIEDMRKEIETISDTAEIEPDFGQMYNKNRAEFGEAKIPLGTDKITVRHNGKGFEIGQTYTISFKADCIPHPSGGLTLTLDRRMDLPTKVKLIPRTKGLPTVDDTLTVNTKTLANVYESVYDFVFENDWAYLESNFTKTAGDQNINRTLNWKPYADGNEHNYTGEWSEAPELIFDGGVN